MPLPEQGGGYPFYQHPPPRRRAGQSVALLIVLGLAGLLGWQLLRSRARSPLHDPGAQPRLVVARGELADFEKSTIELFREASPSVVHITSIARGRTELNPNPFELPRGTGSGVIWDESGYVVTNAHVIEPGNAWEVALSDNTRFRARFVGAAPEKDIAVLKIDAPSIRLRPIPIGSSSDLQVGQTVLAIGNPFGLDQTLTSGVVSGLDREIRSNQGYPIRGVVQTDAAINPGNSGGALLDSSGRLIGINTAIVSPSGAYAGIGFAVPVDAINRVVAQLIRTGHSPRAGLGITLAPDRVSALLAQRGQLRQRGAMFRSVAPGSAAERAGLRPTTTDSAGNLIIGDVIIGARGEAIEDAEDLLSIIGDMQVGDELDLKILRDGEEMTLAVKLQPIT